MIRFAAFLLAALFALAGAAMAETWPPLAPDLSVSIEPAVPGCLETSDCAFLVRVENHGPGMAPGPLRLTSRTAAPSVLGFGDTGGWTCGKLDYGKFACTSAALSLAPGAHADLLLTLRFLPTPMPQADACAALDGSGLRAASQTAVLAALGRTGTNIPDSQNFLRAIYGLWGDGDLRAANDRACTKINLGPEAPPPLCAADEQLANGTCVKTATFCTRGRSWNAASNTCGCSGAAGTFDPVTMSCAAAAAPACSTGRTAVQGLCVCPQSEPLWNSETTKCEALPAPPPKIEAKKVTPPPASAEATPRPRVKVAPPGFFGLKRRPACDPGEIFRRGACIALRKVERRHVAAKPVRTAAKAQPYKSRCPPFFIDNRRRNYCWPGWILDPDLVVNGPYPKAPQ